MVVCQPFRSTRQAAAALFVAGLALTLAPSEAAADLSSYAIVRDDGSLRVGGSTVHLYGIHIPQTGRFCRSSLRPVRCAPRAALALDFIIQGFVRCRPRGRNRDGSITAVCQVQDRGSVLEPPIDLAAWLLKEGWAVSLPGAPFEYQLQERIARARGSGIWGFQADQVR